MRGNRKRRAVVIVAHPDDETLWCGGLMLRQPQWSWHVAALCRGDDPDRAPKFRRVVARLGARGAIGTLDDGPEQAPLPSAAVASAVAGLVPQEPFDLALSHGPFGEYTRHRRHEECCRAVVSLWAGGALRARRLWLFAYEDGGRAYLPRVRRDAARRVRLDDETFAAKRDLIVSFYGFAPETWEARAVPREEGFWCFDDPDVAARRVAACTVPP